MNTHDEDLDRHCPTCSCNEEPSADQVAAESLAWQRGYSAALGKADANARLLSELERLWSHLGSGEMMASAFWRAERERIGAVIRDAANFPTG